MWENVREGEVKPRQLLHLSLPAIVDPMTIVSRRRQIIKILYVIYFAPYFHLYPQLFSISYEDYAHTHVQSIVPFYINILWFTPHHSHSLFVSQYSFIAIVPRIKSPHHAISALISFL